MRDVEALCSRVLVIAHGRVVFDGPLTTITERFGRHKQVRLQFAGEEVPADLAQFGEYTVSGPVAELKVERDRVATVLAAILDRYTVVDMSVQDPPLDQVIGRVFEESAPHKQTVSG
jgi:ABC-2 type transport system ATP-binding protein